VTVDVNRGSYEATLDGDPFISGHTISSGGAHLLRVVARAGLATASKEVRFTITVVGRVVIVRLFNLGANDSGGGGDAILVTDSSSAGQQHALIDTGPAGASGSDPAFVARRLSALGVDSLEFLELTHAHGDHYLGMPAVFNVAAVERFIYNGQTRSLASYQSLVTLARGQADTVIVPAASQDIRLGRDSAAARITVLPPLTSYLGDTDDGDRLNEGSLGSRLVVGTFEMFFSGDGEIEANHRWRTQFSGATASVDVLKVGHHGANNAVFDNGFDGASSWLLHTAPAVAVITANGLTHPRRNALGALLQRSTTRTYCTNVHGEIQIRIRQSGTYEVVVEKNALADCVAGSGANT
jgi:beta-lactamase superfamily II metal-dependent hydrolase